MTIFSKEEMWRVAKEQMGTECAWTIPSLQVITLYGPEDVEELYEFLRAYHEELVDLHEKGIV